MATVREEIVTTASPDRVWKIIREVEALHLKLVPGFVKDTKVEGRVRIVTFGNGLVVREPIVTIDEEHRRLVWTSIGGRLSHYNSSLQVFEGEQGGSKVVWLADLLPDELEAFVRSMIDEGARTMKQTLDAAGRD
jgi:hypothetical protein